tara:strand:- start:591 stop:1574 length:984 start_codon:yes stop_codon:yes gene_type:complete
MSKRSAEGEEVLQPPAAELGPSAAAEPFPDDLVLLPYNRIRSPDEFIATHIASDGSVVLQSETEAVLANLATEREHVAYSLSEAMVHGIAEDSAGNTAFCVSFGDTLTAIFVGASASTSIAMPEGVCGGKVAVCGDTIIAFNQDCVVVNFPLQSPVVHPWRPPAQIAHFIRCRHGPPLIVLADQSMWRPTKTEAGGCEVLPADLLLPTPLCTTDVDFDSGVAVTANSCDTCTVLLSRAFPQFFDVHIPIAPVRASWEGNTLFILGDADGSAHSPVVFGVTPSIGATSCTFYPDRIRFHPSESLAGLNDLRGRFVLWQGAIYLLTRLD